MFVRPRQEEDAVDEIRDIAEAPGLRALAIDCQGRGLKRLDHEVRYHPAVVGLKPWAVGIEDAHEVGIDAVVAVVGHDGGFENAWLRHRRSEGRRG